MSASFSFGDTRFIDPGIAGVALITTVLFLALCDYATHLLEEFFRHSTTYMTMLQKIYKELMVMGLVSFCLVMYQATHPHNSHTLEVWIGTFDFVGYVLFFHAIFTVIHALSIIVWSMLTSREYTRFHLTPIADVSVGIEFLKQSDLYRFLYQLNYFPFFSSRQIAEFKVIHVLFRNTFGVPLDFNFGEYLGKCFERYSLNIIKLSVTSWIVMFILYGLNLIRILSPYTSSFHCDHQEEDDNGDSLVRQLRASSCDLSYLRMFVLCSVALECYVLILFMVGRVYTLRLLKKAGVNEIKGDEDDLGHFLDEEAAREHIALSRQHQQSIPSVTENSEPKHRRMSIKTFSKFIEKAKTVKLKGAEKNDNITSSDSTERRLHKNPDHVSKFRLVANYRPNTDSVLAQKENIFTISRKLQEQKRKTIQRTFSMKGQTAPPKFKLDEDFSDIYAFHSPTLYFRAVEIGIVLNCIYLSLWVSDFIYIAENLSEASEPYQLMMAIPFLVLIPLLTQTVKTASLLAAIAALEVDVIAEVLEESEERTYLIHDLRNRIIQRTAGRGLQQRELLETVFKEIDTDGSGEINRAEFKSLLLQMDMGYSGKKFSKLYNAIDRNGDGSLSLAELNHLLFPQDAKQKEVEELGLKIQSRLDRRITALENEQLFESDSVPLGVHKKRQGQITSLRSLSEATLKPSSSVGVISTILEAPLESIDSNTTPQAQVPLKSQSKDKGTPRVNPIVEYSSPTTPPPPQQGDASRSQQQPIAKRTQSLPPLSYRRPRASSLPEHDYDFRRPSLELSEKMTYDRQLPPQNPLAIAAAGASGRVFSSPKNISQLQSPMTTGNANKDKDNGVFNFRDLGESTLSSNSAVAMAAPPSPREPRLLERATRHFRESQPHLHPRIEPDPDAREDIDLATSQTLTRRTAVI